MKIYQVVASTTDGTPSIRIDSDVFKAYPASERAKDVIERSGAQQAFLKYIGAAKATRKTMAVGVAGIVVPVLGQGVAVGAGALAIYQQLSAEAGLLKTPEAIHAALWKDFRAFAKDYDKGVVPIQRSEVAASFPASSGIGLGFYTAHPMVDDRLVPVEDFHIALKDEKDSELMDLMRLMGATSISIIDRLTHEKGGSAGGAESSSGAGGTFGVGGKSGTESVTKATMSGHDEPVPDDLMEKSIWFRNDPKVLSIFRGRKQGNRIHTFSLQTTYDQSFGFDFDMALKVTKIDLKAKFERLRRVERVFEVSFA
ncbi:hypothetical protein NG827_14780 [Xanthomonas sacchari]|uniref:hypothetical protein n=1 Tax=Xanthomonas sacchari TaxID=56458 RepID=UPI00225B2F90|nr:hypothetical protein [Xanthomonas sacchari]UYK83724.1 hypothetical protein NG827_14780 [Xanthomonas sacchari]